MNSALRTALVLVGIFAVAAMACHGGGKMSQRSMERPGSPCSTDSTAVDKNTYLPEKAREKQENLKTLKSRSLLAKALGISLAELQKLINHAQKVQDSNFLEIVEKVTENELLGKLATIKKDLEEKSETVTELRMEATLENLARKLEVTLNDLKTMSVLAESRKEFMLFFSIYTSVAKKENGN